MKHFIVTVRPITGGVHIYPAIANRIRMIALLHRADRVLHRAKQERERINRPHEQSIHLTGYFVPPQSAKEAGVTPRYVSLVLVLFGAIAILNMARDTIN